ncbi:MAG: MFS transporter [Vulcanimicrobiaceae bacterium]
MAKQFWQLPRAVIPIYGTTLADTLGYTLMIPLLPVVARQYSASDVMVGALLSIPAFCSAIAAPVWGMMSDRLGRKNIIIASQCLSFAGYLLLAIAHSYGLILVSRVISGLGGGSLGAVQSYIADVTEEDQRDTAYAFYGAVFGLAFIVGPVASGFLLRYGFSIPFFVAAALELLNIVFTVFFLPWRNHRRREHLTLRSSLRAANKPSVRPIFIRQFLFIFSVVFFLSNFSLYLQHVLRSSVGQVSWLLAGAGVIGGIVLVVVVPPLAHRIGDWRVAQLGLGCSLIAYAGLVAVTNLYTFCLVLVLWAAGAAMVEPTLTALLSERAGEGERGTIMGVGDSINSIALILAPAMGSAIVGADARLLGVVPAVAIAVALLVGRSIR